LRVAPGADIGDLSHVNMCGNGQVGKRARGASTDNSELFKELFGVPRQDRRQRPLSAATSGDDYKIRKNN
jgi:hypothetical protein